MAVKILMPALSPTMTKGNITKWHKKEGDHVKSGDVLFEIETDKAVMEVESIDEGILAKIIFLDNSKDIPVNEVIAVLREDNDGEIDIDSIVSVKQIEITDAPVIDIEIKQDNTNNIINSHGIKASPLAKKIASQKGIDISAISGSGPYGRIVKNDVIAGPVASGAAYNDIAISNIRSAVASVLTHSKQTTPHFYMTVTCDVTDLLSVRKSVNESQQEKKISVNDMLVKACAMALSESETMCSIWHEDFIRQYSSVSLAVAVAVEGGVITPVIRNACKKSLMVTAKELELLAKKARAFTISPEEYSCGVFTITNLGMLGVEQFGSIIPPMQSGILSIGAGTKSAVVKGGVIAIADTMKITLAADHRVVDGGPAAAFLANFKEIIENPIRILL